MTIPRNLSNLAPGASAGGVLSASYGGTGLTTLTAANNALYSTSASALTAGTLPVAAGGTGSTTLTANNVLLGNGTSALQAVAPGTAGNVLTSNGTTWASSAAPGGGSWIYLSTVTASAAATADIETTFNSTYDTYAIVANNVKTSAVNGWAVRLKIGGSYLTSGYAYSGFYQTSSSTAVNSNSSLGAISAIFSGFSSNNTSVDSCNFIVYVFSPSSTDLYKQISWFATGTETASNRITTGQTSGISTSTSALTGVRFFNNVGNITGTFRLYGIKNS